MEFEIEVSPNRIVKLRELGATEFLQVVEQAGKNEAKATQFGLQRSIVEDNGQRLAYKDLAGEQLARRFSTREYLTLTSAFAQIHLPSAEDEARVRAMRVVES